MNRILITRRNDQILTAVWNGSRVLELIPEEAGKTLQVGDVYLGRVSSLAKNIGAAFVEVQPGVMCFLPLAKDALHTCRVGQEKVVMVTREAVRTKDPVVSEHPSLSGRYLVLLTDKRQIAVSVKIRDAQRREALKQLLSDYPDREGVGFIVRTNAACLEEKQLRDEADRLVREYRQLMDTAAHRPLFTKLRAGAPSWLLAVRDALTGSVSSVVTDQEDIYRELSCSPEFTAAFPGLSPELYRDSYPLEKLYRLEHFLEMALNRRVWLKSGGYLVIDTTEAMTVIDVNTGKFEAHKSKDDTILRTNLEAAEEISLQLRLRNLSGIILVDFIDMERPGDLQQLTEVLERALATDIQKAVLVDFTALGLAEITRKKVRRPLQESIRK